MQALTCEDSFLEMADHIIILSQSPADLKNVLSLYQSYGNKSRVSIVVSNCLSNYQFLDSLENRNFELKVLPGPLPSIKSRLYVSSLLKGLNESRGLLKSLKSAKTLFFFTEHFDVWGFHFIDAASKAGMKVKFIDIYKIERPRVSWFELPFQAKIHFLVFRIFFSKRIFPSNLPNSWIPQFDWTQERIERVDGQSNFDPQSIRTFIRKPAIDQPAVLVFDSGASLLTPWEQLSEAFSKLHALLLEKGLKIFVKGHPSFGTSGILERLGANSISSSIPSELFDYSDFRFAIGFASAAMLSLPKNVKVISLIHLMKSDQDQIKIQALSQLSQNPSIIYLKSWEDLSKSLD